MPFVRLSVAFALEDVAQMTCKKEGEIAVSATKAGEARGSCASFLGLERTSAGFTADLDAGHAERSVDVSLDSSLEAVVKSGPAAASFEFLWNRPGEL